jgi:hypothetical protein
MLKFRGILARANIFPYAARQERTPDLVALASFMLNMSWFAIAGTFILQEYRIGAFEIGSGWTNIFFLFSGIINCSLLIKSRNSFIFAGAGMGALGLLYMLRYIEVVLIEKHELIWRLTGELGEQILLALGLAMAFLFVLAVIFFCLSFQAVKSREGARWVLLTVQVALLTLSLLFMLRHDDLSATPAGAPLALIIVSLLLLPILLSAVLRYAQRLDDRIKKRFFWTVFTIQLITAIGAVYYYAVSPVVRHLGQPVDVREVRLGGRALSLPLIEGGAAYIKIGDGRLLQVNLHTGREQTLARVSLPGPVDIGYSGYNLLGGTEAQLPEGIVRKSPDELTLKYVYSLWRVADQDEVNLSLEVTVNQKTGQASWQLTGFTDRPGYRLPEPASYAGITIEPGFGVPSPLPVRISGAGVETKLAPKGGVSWVYAGQDWLLAGTEQGVLYIIAVGF